MSHNRKYNFSRIAIAGAIATMGLIALPETASAATVQTNAAAGKTAPGQPKFGDKGPHVVAVQNAIIKNGFTLKGGATGVFDRNTLRVLRNFQKVVGLKVTGVVDANTARVLKVATPSTTAAPTTTAAPATTTAAPTTTTAPTAQFPMTATTLPVRGNKGNAVLALQKAIAAAGIPVKGGIDGMFGSGTTTSIAQFQTAKGLPATGVLDVATASALGLIAAPTPAPVAAPVANVSAAGTNAQLTNLPVRGNKGDDVRLVQTALVNAGIEVKGGVDGVFGGATFVAIQKFQSANGISATGILDAQTAIKLGVMAAPAVKLSVFPVQGPCTFTNTWHAPRGTNRLHLGVDIIAKEGNLLYAVTDGVITKMYSEGNDKLAGNGVRIAMADGTYFFYGHMSRVADGIALGTTVKAGQVVGYVGKTGATNTPHLHFEIHPQGGAAIDPTSAVAAIDGCKNTTPISVPAA